MFNVFMNDLSIHEDHCTEEVAVGRLKALCEMVRRARSLDPKFVLNCAGPLSDLHLALNWPMAALRNRRGCAEESLLLRTVQARAPFALAVEEAGASHEYRLPADAETHADEPAVALGLACHFGGVAISFASHAAWLATEIKLDRGILRDDGEVSADEVKCRNATFPADLEHHHASIADQLAIGSGEELWAMREGLFPHLRFIPRTQDQIEGLQPGAPELKSIVDKLNGLESGIARWSGTGSAHPSFGFKIRPESTSRSALVTFNDADLVARVFSLHAFYTPDEGRIHFIPVNEPHRHALVGHVGRKLGIG